MRLHLGVPFFSKSTVSEALDHANTKHQGHGTLHAIYASLEESCKAKGWDAVDLLIIGGDFQVREVQAQPWWTL